MLAIPATIAGCNEIIMCSPPAKDGTIHPAILYCAAKCGIKKIFRAGGAQAVAAMAYGTESIPSVYKIFGPGNQYVTKAKELVRHDGIEIDMPAGPSEVLVIADNTADAEYVAADLLSQAEHGPDSQVMLLTDSQSLTERVMNALKSQLAALPRREIAEQALKNSVAIEFDTIGRCLEFSNIYAPEHLIINTSEPANAAVGITSAGSVFIGPYSCESAGDYASGTNHTLPTGGFARVTGGVSLDSFVKKITFQEVTRKGLKNLSESIVAMAGAESLKAHANAVTVRLNNGLYERD
jgi:histidinol dehydrogenase